MNILFFLTVKEKVAFVEETNSLRQVLEKMKQYGYTAVPLLSKKGEYLGTVTEGDLLWEIWQEKGLGIKDTEKINICTIKRQRDNQAVNVYADMESLLGLALKQNFVPVVDDRNMFIGIVTRKDIISYFANETKKNA